MHILAGGRDARINVCVENFTLIRDPIYGGLTFAVNHERPGWVVQNVGMWIGLKAYIEVLDDGNGQVALDRVLFSDESIFRPLNMNPFICESRCARSSLVVLNAREIGFVRIKSSLRATRA